MAKEKKAVAWFLQPAFRRWRGSRGFFTVLDKGFDEWQWPLLPVETFPVIDLFPPARSGSDSGAINQRIRRNATRDKEQEKRDAALQKYRRDRYARRRNATKERTTMSEATSDTQRKKRVYLGAENSYHIGKRLEELIDPATHYYRLGSGYSDHRLAAEARVSVWSVKHLRQRLFGNANAKWKEAGGAVPSPRATTSINRYVALREANGQVVAQRESERDLLRNDIARLLERIEALENTIFGEEAS